jgi:hypothetical protein
VRLFRVENYERLIIKQARMYWARLPKEVKYVVDVEDMIQEGILFVRSSVIPKYDPKYDTRIITLIYVSLDRFYKQYSIAQSRGKRYIKAQKVPADLFASVGYEGIVDNALAKDSNVVKEIESRQLLLEVYKQASPRLKKYMQLWFFGANAPARVRSGARFDKARLEFLEIANACGLARDNCASFFKGRTL